MREWSHARAPCYGKSGREAASVEEGISVGAGHPQARWAWTVSPHQRGDCHACEPPPPAAPGAPRADERGLAQTVGRGEGVREGERALGPCPCEAPHRPPVSASLSWAAPRAVRVACTARA